ncbi:MAG: AAA family ATPase [Bryobacteraceae bacterium]
MKTIAFFNNKGGVGKTTLAYHLAHMLPRLGFPTLAVDLDPQANLTSAFMDEEELERLWDYPKEEAVTVLGCIEPILQGTGDIRMPELLIPSSFFGPWVLPGDLGLSRFEDKLSDSWPKGYNNDPAALRATSAFYRIIQGAGAEVHAKIALVDVGPNLGAINRSALLAADYIVVPLAADLFSLQGLRNLGPTIRDWRKQWQRIKEGASVTFDLPSGQMSPAGYVVLQHAVRLDRPVRAYEKWLRRIPGEYRGAVLGEPEGDAEPDEHCLATLRNYRSLMPMAQDARKPIFDLLAADGAIGSHAQLARTCGSEFRLLAQRILERCGLL